MSGYDGLREAIAEALGVWHSSLPDGNLRSAADAVLALPEVAALRAKAAAADRVRELADWYDTSPNMNSNRFTADRIRRALDRDGA